MSDPRQIQKRLFQCTKCGTKQIMTKCFRKNKTNAGHIKTAWCYVCKEVTDQAQIE